MDEVWFVVHEVVYFECELEPFAACLEMFKLFVKFFLNSVGGTFESFFESIGFLFSVAFDVPFFVLLVEWCGWYFDSTEKYDWERVTGLDV